jgi:hypothetical protein
MHSIFNSIENPLFKSFYRFKKFRFLYETDIKKGIIYLRLRVFMGIAKNQDLSKISKSCDSGLESNGMNYKLRL